MSIGNVRWRRVAAALLAVAGLTLSSPRGHATVRAAGQPPAAVAGIGQGSFTWIGPGNIGGTVRDLAIDPSNPSKIFAATAAGLWRSLDAGASWSPVATLDGGRVANVSAIEMDPSNPSTLYAALDTIVLGSPSSDLWKSTDGGATWTVLPAMPLPNRGLAISGNGSTILAPGAVYGLQRSTDGGATWALPLTDTLLNVAFVNGGPRAIAIRNAIALFSNDAGATWNTATLTPASTSAAAIGVSATTPGLLYLVTSIPLAIHRSTDGGATYDRVSTLPDTGPTPISTVWVDPANANHVLLAFADLWQTTDGGVTFTKVSDRTLAPASPDTTNAIASDPAFDGATNRRVYFGTGGGIYKADDIDAVNATGTAGYTSLNHGLNITQFYGAAGSSSSGVIVGSSPRGTLRHAAGASSEQWTRVSDGGLLPDSMTFDRSLSTGSILFDPVDANVFYNALVHVVRNSTGGTQASEPIDGTYWNATTMTFGCKTVPFLLTCGPVGATSRFAAVDPNAAQTLLVVAGSSPGNGSLYRTTSAWAPLSPVTAPVSRGVTGILPPGSGPTWASVTGLPFLPTMVAVQKGNSAIMWTGALSSGSTVTLARTTNGLSSAPTWTTITIPAQGAQPHLSQNRPWIALDPVNAAVAYVGLEWTTTTPAGGPTLWKTNDAGTTWTDASGSGATGIPAGTSIHTLVTHPAVPGWLYAGTDAGLYASADAGATWSLAPDGPVGVQITGLSWMGRKLVVATNGRGVYVSARPLDRSTITIDVPASGTSTRVALTVSGWAISESATSGAGIDTIHVYAVGTNGVATFLGVAAYGSARPDVGAIYGSQFTNSGFTLTTNVILSPGAFTVVAYAHNAMTGTFDAAASAAVQVLAPISNGLMNVDTPTSGATLTSAFEVGGWAIDTGAPTGTGVDAVQFYVFPNAGNAPGVFIGQGSYGLARGDVGAAFGSRFTNSGYHFTITGLGPGQFVLGVYARSTVTGTFSIIRTQPFTVSATALMSIDSPRPEVAITANTIGVAGWSIDRAVESSGPSGTGVDLLHVYAYPNPGSGQAPIFLGIASVGVHRPDVGALYGTRYDDSGYTLTVDRAAAGLTPGIYNIVVHSHSTVTGAFNNVALVQVTLQ